MKLSSVAFGNQYLSLPGIGVRQGVSVKLAAVKSIELVEPACVVVRIVTAEGVALVPWAQCQVAIPDEQAAQQPSGKGQHQR